MWFFFTVLLITILIIDAEITMCCFKFSVTFYCDSHLSQQFSGLSMHAFNKYGSDSFTGVRPLVVPLDRTLSLLSARSPLH